MKYLRFESEQAMLDAFEGHMVEGQMPQYVGSAAVDVVGLVYQPTGVLVETNQGQVSELAAIPGWHVNLSAGVPALEQFEIPAPSSPSRVFAVEPEPLRVPQEVTMAQCRLALFDKHGIETDEQFYALTDMLPEADRARARLELRTRPTVRYDNPFVIAFCAVMGWDRDTLFIYAATL